jgi:hypothetical protein
MNNVSIVNRSTGHYVGSYQRPGSHPERPRDSSSPRTSRALFVSRPREKQHRWRERDWSNGPQHGQETKSTNANRAARGPWAGRRADHPPGMLGIVCCCMKEFECTALPYFKLTKSVNHFSTHLFADARLRIQIPTGIRGNARRALARVAFLAVATVAGRVCGGAGAREPGSFRYRARCCEG